MKKRCWYCHGVHDQDSIHLKDSRLFHHDCWVTHCRVQDYFAGRLILEFPNLPLTDKQKTLLNFIQQWHQNYGNYPTNAIMQRYLGLKYPVQVTRIVRSLINQGYLEPSDSRKHRSLL